MSISPNRQQRRALKGAKQEEPVALLVQAQQLYRQQKLSEAASLIRRYLAACPGHSDSMHMLGVIALQQHDFAQAAKWLAKAIAQQPEEANYHSNLAVSLEGLGRLEEAEASCRRALDLKPDFPQAWNNRGNVLMRLNRRDEAETCYRRALELAPGWADAHSHLSEALQATNQPEEALVHARQAVVLDPNDPSFQTCLGNALRELGRWDEALSVYDAALEKHPGHSSLLFNRSLALLYFGRFPEGWRDYEQRLQSNETRKLHREISRPVWDGSPLKGGRLLIYSEQGFGDTIQFCRLMPMLAPFGGKILLDVQPALRPLLADLPGVENLSDQTSRPPAFDAHCSLLSLPRLLGLTLDDIPAAQGYLRADPVRQERWRHRLGPASLPRIGLAWRGSSGQKRNDARSVAAGLLGQWLRNADLPQAEWICLQKDAEPEEVAALGIPLVLTGPDLQDFADTAALMSCLDLVISVETSISHLAGALGCPVWTMLDYAADWRYLQDREDSPWYASMRLFRQSSPGDWPGVFAAVEAALRARSSQA